MSGSRVPLVGGLASSVATTALGTLAALAACSNNGGGTTALFAAPGATTGDDFYALPYPNDLRRHDDGTLDLSLFPTNSLIVDSYRMYAETLDGFGLNAAIYARFDGPLDPTTLPDPAGSVQPGASVYLVNVDAASPNLGMRSPVIATFRADGTNTIGKNRLVVRPYPGFGLDEATTYALVITTRLHGGDGASVLAASDFQQLLGSGGGTPIAHARTVYAPLLAYLDQPGDDERKDVVSAAVFTTQHATFVAPAIRKAIYATPAPVATGLAMAGTNPDFTLYTGNYTAPNFQTGDVPYSSTGGEIQIGADGAAIVQRPAEPMRFALTVPPGVPPAAGWPLCIYQHGTGGDWMSFVQDGTATQLAGVGIATISTDQVLHGPRNPGGNPDVAFFNFGNPLAGRDNALQGAADAWSQQRLALGLSFLDASNQTITFDQSKLSFFGHSQGGLTGPPYLAFEPAVTGAVLSGTGGLLYLSMLYKTAPVNFPQLVETLARDTPMDEDNPSIALAQMWIERSDGANYARLLVREPPPGVTAKNIFQTEGFVDSYAPNPTIEGFATAVAGDLVMLPDEQEVTGLTLRASQVLPTPITHNRGTVTAVLAQYKQAPGDDGHFVVFDVATARKQSTNFLGNLASTGQATVVSP